MESRLIFFCLRRPRFWLIALVMAFAALRTGSPLLHADEESLIVEKPLAPLSGPRGPTLFKRLSSEETGIKTENNYADPKMWGDRYLEFAVGGIGSGVAIGDFDGDGLPDVFVVSKTESCRLFRNLGNWKFEDVTDKAGVGDKGDAALIWKQGATFVDINNDGKLDIYVCRFGAPNLLYINQGDGTFKEMAHAYGLDVVDACGMASFCDYDRDGWLDVFIQTNLYDIANHPNGQRNYLFHNNGDGTFTNVTDRAGISGEAQGHSATWWDFDGDGWPDLYVANDFGTPDKLYHNNRDGTFTDVIADVVPHTTFASMGSDFGDINNDGFVDFLVADMAATTHEKDQRTASGVRAGVIDPAPIERKVPKYLHNALYLNTGTGRCREAAFLAGVAATDWTWAVRFEDLDNDGRLDLFVTNGMNREQSNIDLIAREMNAETAAERIRIMRDSPVMAERHLALRNKGNLEFEDVSAAWGLDQRGVAFGAAFGDLDGDGDLDLVYNNFQASAAVLRNDSDHGHRVIFELRGRQSNRFGIGALVRIQTASGIQVRPLMLARGYMSSSEPIAHFGLGDDTTLREVTIYWPSGQIQSFHDLPADRRFIVTEPSGKAVLPSPTARPQPEFVNVSESKGLSVKSREEEVDELSVQKLLPFRLNRRGPALAVGDLRHSGTDDIVIGGTTLDPLRVLYNDGKGSFTAEAPALTPAQGVDDGPVLLFDANGDGALDLLVTRGGNALPFGSPEYQPHLYLNDGHGHFLPAADDALPPLPISAGAVVAADFLHDGKLGVFIGARVRSGEYPLAPTSALLANRGGKFEDITDRFAPALRSVGMVTSALWTDVDQDGWPDLVLTLEWGQVKYFHNNRGQGLEDWTDKSGFASAGTGWWTSIAAADFNGDGKLDYIVGNIGLNTQYHADAQHPAVLYSGDFKGDGSNQLIEAYYEGDRLVPWRSRHDLGSALPAVLRKFPRNDAYARATLAEILGQAKLEEADKFTATELRSGVLLSQPDGSYRFEPLPRIAQIAPLQGIVTGDFDGDGNADFYAVQNSFAPIPSIGRFDGGLSQLFRGDGKGHFAPVPVIESGSIVTDDAKAVVQVDADGNAAPVLLASRNNGTTIAFSPNLRSGFHSFRVRLREHATTAPAVGARATLTLANGLTETFEVYAGSSEYSQSTSDLNFLYSETNPPRSLRVAWPSRRQSIESIANPPKALITLTDPGE